MSKKISNPWDFIPTQTDSRFNFPRGAGDDHGKAKKNAVGLTRVSSVVERPQDKISGFKKRITQA